MKNAIKYWSRMDELACFKWKCSKRLESYQKNDKFVTSKTKIYFISFIFFIKLMLNFQLIVFYFSSYVSFQKTWMRKKKWCSTEKDEKVTYRQHATKLFSRLLLFSVICTFEENLYNDDMYIFDGIPGVTKCNL